MNNLMKKIQKLNNRKGFTLIELIVVIAIIGILAAILIPQFTGFQNKAKSTQAMVDAKQIATAADGVFAETGKVPTAAQIKLIAGEDIDDTKITGIALTAGATPVQFTYTCEVDGTTFEAKRDDKGKIVVTQK